MHAHGHLSAEGSDLHKEWTFGEHVCAHRDACQVAYNFQGEPSAHSECVGICFVEEAHDGLEDEEDCEYYDEYCVG